MEKGDKFMHPVVELFLIQHISVFILSHIRSELRALQKFEMMQSVWIAEENEASPIDKYTKYKLDETGVILLLEV